MPLEIVKRKGSPFFYLRGTVKIRGQGKTIFESTGIPLDRRDIAEQARAKRETELYETALYGERAVVSFERAARAYLSFEPRSENTTAFVERLISHFGNTLLGALGQTEAERAVNLLLGSDALPATKVRVVYTPLGAIMAFAAMRGWCPPPTFHKPAVPRADTRWLAPAEALALIEAAASHLRPLLRFLLCTGARLSEALDLQWTDVDLPAARVMLRGTKARAGHEKDRLVLLPPFAVTALANIPHEDPDNPKRKGAVFRRDDGLPYEDRKRQAGGQIKTAWRTACMKAQVRDATPHDCRHSWATWYYAITKDLLELRDRGGWASTAIVERYAHLMGSELVPEIAKVWGPSHPWIGPLPTTKDPSDAHHHSANL